MKFLEAAYREMGEETGIEKCKVALIKQSKLWYRYDLPNEIQGKFWGGKFRAKVSGSYLNLSVLVRHKHRDKRTRICRLEMVYKT